MEERNKFTHLHSIAFIEWFKEGKNTENVAKFHKEFLNTQSDKYKASKFARVLLPSACMWLLHENK